MSLRGNLLAQARDLTDGARNLTYGSPVANMQHTADIFNAIVGGDKRLDAYSTAMFLVSVKLARLRTSPHHEDNYIDAMAYLGIAAECALERQAGEEKKMDDLLHGYAVRPASDDDLAAQRALFGDERKPS